MIFLILNHEIRLALTKGSGVLNLLAFFVIASILFPLGIGPDSAILQTIGVGVIWVCALLTSMLSLPMIFSRDYEDGMLEQFLLQGSTPETIVIAKIIAHWCIACLPLIIISPLIAYMFQLDEESIINMLISLAIGTPVLSLIGTMGAALTLGAKRTGNLLGLLVLPLYIPVLIFGVSSTLPGAQNIAAFSPFYLLIALLLIMLPLGITASTFAMKLAVEES